jgi:uncharacterized membrane protein YebE (DUF533 family)
MNDLTPDETEAILTLCLMAAFADGEKHEREREQIRRIAESFRGSEVDLSALYQEVLLRKPEPAAVAARLSTPGAASSPTNWLSRCATPPMHAAPPSSNSSPDCTARSLFLPPRPTPPWRKCAR